MSERILKINKLIKQQIGQIISREIEFPNNSLVTITRVETTSDMKTAKVFISVIPENFRGSSLELLRKNTKLLSQQLKKQVAIKFVPNLNFLIDDQEAYAVEIDKLLDEIS
ncbi:30S ribosome-binding factor RbfA [Patescibacteria group bacterium]